MTTNEISTIIDSRIEDYASAIEYQKDMYSTGNITIEQYIKSVKKWELVILELKNVRNLFKGEEW